MSALCGAFPTLFDLVDENSTQEVHGVDKKDYWKVVDQCYLCDLCYMTKCPYVPPHEWNVDFPHTMLRAKAIKFKKRRRQLRREVPRVHRRARPVRRHSDRGAGGQCGEPDQAGARRHGTACLHVDRNAWMPSLATRRFRSGAAEVARTSSVKDGMKTPGKVAIFSTCYINYNEPGIGHDLLKVLEHNEVPYVLVEKEKCCGMPKLELGDLDSVARSKEANIPVLAKYAREGFAILTAVPSCTLMFKQEIPLMYPDDADVQAVKEAMWDPFEYLAARKRDGLLKTDFSQPLGKVSYHVPCHNRVQNIGRKTEELLKLVPGTFVQTNERCSGHAGTFGVKKPFHDMAMKIGKPLFKKMAEHPQGGTARLHQLRLPAGRPPHQPGVRRQFARHAAAGSSDHAAADGLRIELTRVLATIQDMQLTGKITRDSLMTLEAYSKWRKAHKAEIIAHRKLRSVALGDHVTLQFESETTIRYQIQEMLRIEKIFEEEGIEQEIAAYAPLMPDGSNWKATMMIEYPDVNERQRELARLIGVEDRMFVEVEGQPRVYAIADEDLDRENDEKTSAVHFVRFEFTPAMVCRHQGRRRRQARLRPPQLPGPRRRSRRKRWRRWRAT